MSESMNNKNKKQVTYSTLSSKNQITVPSIIREKLNAEPGDQVVFKYDEEAEEVTVSNIKKDTLLSLFGSMPPKGEKSKKEWNVIRKEAKEGRYAKRYTKE